MTLRARLLLATCVLSLAITLGLSLLVRRAWEQTERERFDQSFQRAIAEVRAELELESEQLARRLTQLCTHDTAVDSALLGVETNSLASRLLPVSLALEEQRKALELDELGLVDSRGQILAGQVRGTGARIDDALLERVRQRRPAERAPRGQMRHVPVLGLEAFCRKGEREPWVALVGFKAVARTLDAAATHHDLQLVVSGGASGPSPRASDDWSETISLSELGHLELIATRSRAELSHALARVDLSLAGAALASLAMAVGVAILLSGGLARPIIAFAERTRAAVRGQAEPLPIEGGPELEQAARAFNQTLADLARLKLRLQVTERIAARRDLARQVAHEIKNPLMPIRTSVEMLQKLRQNQNPAFDDFVDEALATVQSELRRIGKLVDNFAAYGRLPHPSPTTFDLGLLLGKLTRLHEHAGVAIELVSPPRATAPLLVTADADQLTQAFTNLFKNASEALTGRPGGKIEVQIVPAELRDDGLVAVVVCDNGPGVPPELLTHLMEPYRTSKRGGTGLGLAVSQRIAVEHGGDLTYESRAGACFTFTFQPEGPPLVS